MYFLYLTQKILAPGRPAALGLGRPGALPAGLVQSCPKPRALFHKHILNTVKDIIPDIWLLTVNLDIIATGKYSELLHSSK